MGGPGSGRKKGSGGRVGQIMKRTGISKSRAKIVAAKEKVW